ncbi:MAG: TolC family protein [Bacteroidales bacterium]|nr:TolC family protein [Bacteroidales bacterium]
MRFLFVFSLFSVFSTSLSGQYADTVSLIQCFEKAEIIHPLNGQKPIYQEISDKRTSNLSKAWLPSFNLEGQATYQSDVVEVDFSKFMPQQSFSFTSPHDQYKIYLSLEQKIYDGGLIKTKKRLKKLGFRLINNR